MRYLLKVYTISEVGQRPNQEDSLWPEYGRETDADRLFIVCDGIGGHKHGEMASQTVCQAIGRWVALHTRNHEQLFGDQLLDRAIGEAYDMLDSLPESNDTPTMGTTLALLKLHEGGATIAHIGDSRVYHIRPGRDARETRILFRTRDHAAEEKGVISRAMQPRQQLRTMPEVHHIADIRPGDYFYICSDGMLEQMSDENICFNFSHITGTDDNKVDILRRATGENTDNHSAIVVHVIDTDGQPVAASTNGEAATAAPLACWAAFAAAAVVAVAAACYLLWPKTATGTLQDDPSATVPPVSTAAPARQPAETQQPQKPEKRRKKPGKQQHNGTNTTTQQATGPGSAVVNAAAGNSGRPNSGQQLQQAVGTAAQGIQSSHDDSPEVVNSDQDQIGTFMQGRKKKK